MSIFWITFPFLRLGMNFFLRRAGREYLPVIHSGWIACGETSMPRRSLGFIILPSPYRFGTKSCTPGRYSSQIFQSDPPTELGMLIHQLKLLHRRPRRRLGGYIYRPQGEPDAIS